MDDLNHQKRRCMKNVCLIILLFSIQFGIKAQERIINNHFFLNSYFYNPAFAGKEGRANVSLNHRQQWRGIDGAPITSIVSFDVPFNNNLNTGIKIINDQKSILNSTTVFLTLGYTASFSRDKKHSLSFGISGGALKHSIDTDESLDFNDPEIIALFNNTTRFLSEFGINYRYYDLNIGFSLPVLMDPSYSSEEFSFDPLNELLFMGSYVFQLPGNKIALEPYFLYRIKENLPAQFEATGIMRFNDLFWIGGAYRQDYGASALVGLHVGENVKIGYAYEFAAAQVNSYTGGSHEIQLSMGLGDKEKKAKRMNPRFRH